METLKKIKLQIKAFFKNTTNVIADSIFNPLNWF